MGMFYIITWFPFPQPELQNFGNLKEIVIQLQNRNKHQTRGEGFNKGTTKSLGHIFIIL